MTSKAALDALDFLLSELSRHGCREAYPEVGTIRNALTDAPSAPKDTNPLKCDLCGKKTGYAYSDGVGPIHCFPSCRENAQLNTDNSE